MTSRLFRQISILLIGACLMLSAGCGTSAPTRFYVLNPMPGSQEGSQVVLDERCLAIGIGPVNLPQYLERPQIVTRVGSNEMQLADFDQWAEPLKDNFTRVLAENLSALLCADAMAVFPGGSGCGKSTLLRHMIGLKAPAKGRILYEDVSYWEATAAEQERLTRKFGVLYQAGALWSSMTLAENVALPLGEYTDLRPDEIREVVAVKLALVGLAGFEDFYPSEISGGMRKRAGLARAMAMDPEILFFDEPSAGLDPISARRLDDLILELRESLGTTIVVVTHELASIFAIANNSVFLDTETRTMAAVGNPKDLLAESKDPKVRSFLTRGEEDGSAPAG